MVADTLPRRLAAILHLDVVEFSRLTHDNEDATYRTLQNYLRDIDAIIKNRGGRTADRSGDNLLAVFPVAADSVMAAVNIQEWLTTKNAVLPADRQIHTRIGINLGDIIDDGQRVFGDGVNVAARLQEIAPPGGICISDSARVVIGNTLSVSFQAVGKQQLRNIASKISAHLVINGSDQPQKATPSQAIKASTHWSHPWRTGSRTRRPVVSAVSDIARCAWSSFKCAVFKAIPTVTGRG